MSFYTQEELNNLGFKSIGDNVLISRKASFYGIENISIDDNSRIDDFCVLSSSGTGEIKIGKNVHIAVYSCLIGKEDINVNDYANISSRVSIYSSTDDFSGNYMTNPTVDERYTNVISIPVFIGSYVVIGSGSVVLPGSYLSDGVAVGAMSLIKKRYEEFIIVAGCPAVFIKKRSDKLKLLLSEIKV